VPGYDLVGMRVAAVTKYWWQDRVIGLGLAIVKAIAEAHGATAKGALQPRTIG